MAYQIGFTAKYPETKPEVPVALSAQSGAARPSVVRVHFPTRDLTLSYYNDRFDLHTGNLVFVEGKLEGLPGRVVEVSHQFKIRLADYKRVLSVADTEIQGRFWLADSHFVTFDPSALPYAKAITWFKAPPGEEDEYVCGQDEKRFWLSDLPAMGASPAVAERGHELYAQNRVVYLELDGGRGRAIVEGSQPYELEFAYHKGEISRLTCPCFCSGPCKHQFAAMLQLRETLTLAEKRYGEELDRTGYLAAVPKSTFFSVAIDSRETGSICL